MSYVFSPLIIPILELNGGVFGTVKGTDVYPAVDTTDLTQSPTGTTKPYQVIQLINYILDSLNEVTYSPVLAASTVDLDSTYNNGVLGVGATLTNAGIVVPFSLDEIPGVVGGRYLIKNQTNAAYNGIYVLTVLGNSSPGTNWVLTRSTDFNTSANIFNNGIVYVQYGATNANTLWQDTFTAPLTVGTTNINWIPFQLVPEFPLSTTYGGTGADLTPQLSNGGIVYSTATTFAILAAASSPNQILLSGSPPSWIGLSPLMDLILGSTQGDIIYRGATDWTVLAPGTSGYLLQTQGPSANPTWVSASGAGDLLAVNNLSDVDSTITSLYNLRRTGDDLNAINTTTVLTATAFGMKIVCSGSSAYTVTLPTVTSNNGRYIDFQVLTSSNALVTISPASGTIQLQSTFILGTGESCRVWTDGTNWWVEGLNLMPVYFSAYPSANQNISSSATIAFDTATYDVGSFFNTSTHVYTPLYPGSYNVNATVYFNNVTASFDYQVRAFKNAAIFVLAENIAPFSTTMTLSFSSIITLNGSSDGISLTALMGAAAQVYSNSGTQPYLTYFQAYRMYNF